MSHSDQLSRRERQIMDILYRLGEASVKEVMDGMKDAPSYSSVRTLIGKLLEKGHVGHKESGLKYVYFPLVAHDQASRSALGNLVKTYFDNSPYLAVNSLLEQSIHDLSDDQLDELNTLIQTRKQQKNTQ